MSWDCGYKKLKIVKEIMGNNNCYNLFLLIYLFLEKNIENNCLKYLVIYVNIKIVN